MKNRISKLISKSVVILTALFLFVILGVRNNNSSMAEYSVIDSNQLTVKITTFSRAIFKPPSTTKASKATIVKQKATTSFIRKKPTKSKVKRINPKKQKKTKETYQIIRGYSPPKNVNTSFKSYMCYRAITCVNSNQYILQQKAHTDKDGIRRVEKDVCIALGTRYSSTVGERFLIELDTGQSFTAIVGDIKSDAHTDKKTHSYIEANGNVVEFIVDDQKISNDIKFTGNVSCIDKYKGQIKAIVRIA